MQSKGRAGLVPLLFLFEAGFLILIMKYVFQGDIAEISFLLNDSGIYVEICDYEDPYYFTCDVIGKEDLCDFFDMVDKIKEAINGRMD